MPKVGVILSGCGFLDGAEIHESVAALLALDQKGATYVCYAPNVSQPAVVDHETRQATKEMRNVLKESARIARCEINDVATADAGQLDALIIPGGFGAAKNLCTFADDGPECSVNPEVEKLVVNMIEQRKPVGAICIAPALLARIAGKSGVKGKLTIGNDAGTAKAITAMGCVHENCPVTECLVDQEHKLVTTPAYMVAKGPAEVFEGVRKLVDQVLALI